MKVYEATMRFKLLREEPELKVISTPVDVFAYMAGAFDDNPLVESLWVIPVTTKYAPLGRVKVSQGILDETLFHCREAFKPLILASAYAFVLVHNHPSGNPTPSRADFDITQHAKGAGELLGIPLLDHVIIGEKSESFPSGMYSFKEYGRM